MRLINNYDGKMWCCYCSFFAFDLKGLLIWLSIKKLFTGKIRKKILDLREIKRENIKTHNRKIISINNENYVIYRK